MGRESWSWSWLCALLLAAPCALATTSRATGYLSLPLAFERNLGQADAQVDFMARAPGYQLWLSGGEAVMALSQARGQPAIVRLQLLGARKDAPASGREQLPGMVNYFSIDHRETPIEQVPRFASVHYRGVYPGIDLVYHSDAQERLEFDFVLAAGADPARIGWTAKGVDQPRLREDGALELGLGGRSLLTHRPVAYQVSMGVRRAVDVEYQLDGARIGFVLGNYDRALPLVIDPVISYSTYLGGSSIDGVLDIARGSDGSVYLTGYTYSIDFPTVNAIHGHLGAMEAFVSKIQPNGSQLGFSTYIGGVGDQRSNAIELDPLNRVLICGSTEVSGSSAHPFVLRLNPNGSLSWTRTLTTQYWDGCNDLAMDGERVVAVGYTQSANDFPRVNQIPAFNVANGHAPFLVKYDAAGNLIQSTLLPNTGWDASANGVAVKDGFAYVTGSIDLGPPSPGALNDVQAFVLKINDNAVYGDPGEYHRRFGGSTALAAEGLGPRDSGQAIIVDSTDRAFIAGRTASTNFPVTPGVFQPAYDGGGDGFIVRLSPVGAIAFASYVHAGLGANVSDEPARIAFDASNTVYMAGSANSGYPWIARLPGFATSLDYATSFGSFYLDVGPIRGLAMAATAQPVIAGEGARERMPVSANAVQSSSSDFSDGYVMRLEERLPLLAVPGASVSEAIGCVDLAVRTDLPATGQIRFDWAAQSGTAIADTDFYAGSGEDIGISPGSQIPNVNVSVCIENDALDEANETLTVNFTNITGATPASVSAVITIVDDDAPPTLAIDNAGCTVTEGNSGTSNCAFILRLNQVSGRTVSLNSATANGTAISGSDYTGHPSTARSLVPGQSSLTISVPVIGDTLDEPNESFSLNLSGIANATPGTLTATGTITDNDPAPTLALDNGGECLVSEGNSGSTPCTFVFRLSAASGQLVSLSTATSSGTATAGSDFTAHAATVRSIAIGQSTLSVSVPVLGDTAPEADESFGLNVTAVSNASFTGPAAVGVILNDDGALPNLIHANGFE